MARPAPLIEHLYRRAGFGLSAAERAEFSPAARSTRTGRALPGANGESYRDVVEALLAYDTNAADATDLLIGQPGYAGITTIGPFTPNTDINHARQRWLFRMVHSPAPLQEKMALFWHQPFATAFQQDLQGLGNSVDATRLMAAKPATDAAGQRGQIELFRQHALGNFKDLLVEVAKDPAMLLWLDGATNTKNKPQGELRPGADGAVHLRRGALRRVRRLRRRARVHRLESSDDRCARVGLGLLRVFVQARQSRDGGQGFQLSHLRPGQQPAQSHSGASGGGRDAGRP